MTNKYYIYEGEWVHGKEQSDGEMKYTDRGGDIVKGTWMNGNLRTGKVVFANGDEDDGELKNGMPSGQGKLTKTNGVEYDGEWKNGRLVG